MIVKEFNMKNAKLVGMRLPKDFKFKVKFR